MKTALFFILIFCCAWIQGQESYSFPGQSRFLELPGNSFLVYRFAGSTTYLQEIDEDGSLLWEDSVAFQAGDSAVYLNSLLRFEGTTDFLLIMRKSLHNILPEESDYLFQFTRFSLSNHNQQHRLDSLTLRKLHAFPMQDTTICVLHYKNTSPLSVYRELESYAIDRNLAVTLIAPQDSMRIVDDQMYEPFFFQEADTIHQLFTTTDSLLTKRWLPDMSDLSPGQDYASAYRLPGDYFNVYNFYRPLSPDSLLVVSYGVDMGSFDLHWFFGWFDYRLNVRRSATLTSYFGIREVIFANDTIYVLAYSQGDLDPTHRILSFDREFNLLCQTEYLSFNLALEALNDAPYLGNYAGGWHYEAMDGCGQVSLPENPVKKTVLYPNPVRERLRIEHSFPGTAAVRLLDFSGRVVRDFGWQPPGTELDLKPLAPGIYFVEISCGAVRELHKIVKE